MIILQALMMLPAALLFVYLVLLLVFFLLILVYNFVERRIYKEEARTITPLWAFVFAFIGTIFILIWFMYAMDPAYT